MLLRYLTLAVTVLVLTVPPLPRCWADDGPTAGDLAGQVLDALDAGKVSDIKRIARDARTDPWLVVEILLEEDEADVAKQFASFAAKRKDAKKLPAYVKSRQKLGSQETVLRLLDRVEDAFDARDAKRVAALTEKLSEKHPSIRHVSLRVLRAEALDALGMNNAAGQELQRAAEAAEALGWYAQAVQLWDLAADLLSEGMAHEAAEHGARRVLSLAKTLDNDYWLAFGHDRLGSVRLGRADYDGAIEAHREALRLWRSSKNTMGEVNTLASIAAVQEDDGEYAQALETLDLAAKRLEGIDDERARANLLAVRGKVHESVGNLPRARTHLEEALKVHETIGDKYGQADALFALAELYSRLGDEHKCIEFNKRAMVLFEEVGSEDGRAAALSNIGAAYEDLDDPVRAREYYEQALALHAKLGLPTGEAKASENLGLLLIETGEFDKALPYLKRALALVREAGSRRQRASAHESLALGYYKSGEYEAALKNVRQAYGELRELLRDLGENETNTIRGAYEDIYVLGAASATRLKRYKDAIRYLEEGRAMTLASRLTEPGRRKIPRALRRDEQTALANVQAARIAFDAAESATGKPPGKEAKETRALEEAVDGLRQVRDRIRKATGIHRVETPPAARLADVQANLREGQVFAFYQVAGDNILAICVRPNAVCSHVLPDSDGVEETIESMLGQGGIASRGFMRRNVPTKKANAPDTLARLREALIVPLQLGPSDKELIVSPAGELSYVPFAAIVDRPVAAVPSATTWLVLKKQRSKPGHGVLALGNPDYPGKAKGAHAVRMKGEIPSLLPATKPEVLAVGDTKLLGAEASEQAFRRHAERAERWRSLHFACHGLLDPQFPQLSALALARAKAENDGLLTGHEILGMKLRADIAVLSACETGTGKILDAEGISGLTRAFMIAGVPRVVCSLWKVDDEATKALMVKFYELWNPKTGKGLPTAEALAKAQAHVRAQPKWERPYYWAAWVLWGLPD